MTLKDFERLRSVEFDLEGLKKSFESLQEF
jgi:hypothetical protein